MDHIVKVVAFVIGMFGGSYAVLAGWDNRPRKKGKVEQEVYPTSFSKRIKKMDSEAKALSAAEAAYQDRIDAAFIEALSCGALVISEVDYHDVESDRYSSHKVKNTLLTRFMPIVTRELAESIRAFEIHKRYEHESAIYKYEYDSESLSNICMAARNIKWRVEEVPVKYEPPKIRVEDRICYPDLSGKYGLPDSLRDAARMMLGYDDDYVKKQADLLIAKESAEEDSEVHKE